MKETACVAVQMATVGLTVKVSVRTSSLDAGYLLHI